MKHLIDIKDLSVEEINELIKTATSKQKPSNTSSEPSVI